MTSHSLLTDGGLMKRKRISEEKPVTILYAGEAGIPQAELAFEPRFTADPNNLHLDDQVTDSREGTVHDVGVRAYWQRP